MRNHISEVGVWLQCELLEARRSWVREEQALQEKVLRSSIDAVNTELRSVHLNLINGALSQADSATGDMVLLLEALDEQLKVCYVHTASFLAGVCLSLSAPRTLSWVVSARSQCRSCNTMPLNSLESPISLDVELKRL